MARTLMECLADSGYPKEKMFGHESDLYIYANRDTEKVIKEWLAESKFCSFETALIIHMVEIFTSATDGKTMFDIAFAYDPYWESKCRKENKNV